MGLKLNGAIALAFGLAGAVTAAVAADKAPGYLSPDEFDVTYVLEPAPRAGDPRYETDREIFRATRGLIGSERWKLATDDADESAPGLLGKFSCSVGVSLTTDNAPKLAYLLRRAAADTALQTARAKDVYRRERPFLIDEGEVCQPTSRFFNKRLGRNSYDYPSGHTTRGWTWALVLASLAPDRAARVLERGRVYGDSRFVCGAHNQSAVEAGMVSASATMAVVSANLEYQADLAAARAELAQLRARGSKPQGCEAEAALMRLRVMPKLDGATEALR